MISRNAVIGFLLFTALTLATVLAFEMFWGVESAEGATVVEKGRYVLMTGKYDSNTDVLWVGDMNLGQLFLYGVERRGNIVPLSTLNLADLFSQQGMDEGLAPGQEGQVRPNEATRPSRGRGRRPRGRRY